MHMQRCAATELSKPGEAGRDFHNRVLNTVRDHKRLIEDILAGKLSQPDALDPRTTPLE